MNLDLVSDPFFGALLFFVFVPTTLAFFWAVKPLRKLLEGVLFAGVALPLVLSSFAFLLVICFLLTADLVLRSKSVTSLIFGSEFSRFEEILRSTNLANLEAQFGPFDYFALLENPCLLDYYSEEKLGHIPNMLIGGVQKIACYKEWSGRVEPGDSDSKRTKNSIEYLLNANLNSGRSDLSLDDLSEVTLLKVPKLVTVDVNNECIARAVYNTEIVLNGATTKVSITDHYNFEKVKPDNVIIPWGSNNLTGYGCHDHCYTRRLSLDLSSITTPLRYSEFAKSYFSAGADKSNVSDTKVDRAEELFLASRKKQEKELLASEPFQNWLYLRNEYTEDDLRELLAKTEIDFETISEGTNRKWIERNWEHPFLFDGYDLREWLRPEWERSLSTIASDNKSSSLFLRDDVIYYLTNKKLAMDEIIRNCSAR